MLEHVEVKYYKQDYECNVVPDTLIYIEKTLFLTCPFCVVTESRNHFFSACPLYSLDRLRYLQANLDNLTSNAILFGCENQTNEFNESLFLEVQEFLIRSGRFG